MDNEYVEPLVPWTITVGELRRLLQGYNDRTPLFFGEGDLAFGRFKMRGDMLQLEFETLYQIIDPPFADPTPPPPIY